MAQSQRTCNDNSHNPWDEAPQYGNREVRKDTSPTAGQKQQFIERVTEIVKDVQSETRSEVRSTRTKGSSRSRSRISEAMSSRKIDAVINAAALKARLKYIDEENKMKAQLEKLQAMRELHVAESQIEAFTQLEQEDSSSSSRKSLPLSDGGHDYVREYVESVQRSSSNASDPSAADILQSGESPPDDTDSRRSVKQMLKPDIQTSKTGASLSTSVQRELAVPLFVERPTQKSSPSGLEFQLDANSKEFKPRTTEQSGMPSAYTKTGGNNKEFKPRTTEQSGMPSSYTETKSPGTLELPAPARGFPAKQQLSDTGIPPGETYNHSPIDSGSQLKDSNQLQIFKLFAEQINLGRLPPPEPGVFTGNPIDYPAWSTAFDILIEKRGIPPAERLYYLKKYLAGEAKETVEGYLLLDSADAYSEAKRMLETRYGDAFVIAHAFRSKLEAWDKGASRDGPALRKYADFLRQCETAMLKNESLKVLDDMYENRKMVAKLPEWLVHRWSRVVSDFKEKESKFPPFSRFVKFVSAEAKIACEPALAGLTQRDAKSTPKSQQKPSRSLATEVKPNTRSCTLCKKDHFLDQCEIFLKKTLRERKDFTKTKGLCFGCLKPGHRSKECKRRLVCETCKRKHPTPLHGDTAEKKTENKTSTQEGQETKVGTTISHASHQSNTMNASKCTMIVPVWISHQDTPDNEKLIYALLDTQSDTTFLLEDTCSALGVDGPEVKLLLSTMSTSNQMVDSRKIAGLQVRAYNSSLKLALPDAYTREIMPANRSHIPTPEMARKWPHLEVISNKLMPLSDCEVGLLIGYNCSRALAPREVIPPQVNEPYGQRTDLGWGIVGKIDPNEINNDDDHIGVSHRIITCEISQQRSIARSNEIDLLMQRGLGQAQISLRSSVKEVINPHQVTRMMELDFSESQDGKMLSQEDKRFLKIMDEGIVVNEKQHYEMPLPFKHGIPTQLPNNKSQALQRLRQLERCYLKDPNYKRDYVRFMRDIIDKEYAEEVPEEELPNSAAWYVPHHGVYHPKKPEKIRVVFDCSARYQGEALNDYLLQGPDLTNTLVGVLCRFRMESIAVMCDIEQMFFQFNVAAQHRDLHRFLWWKDDDLTQPVEFRMRVHLFGAVSSPGCANFALKQMADDYEDDFGSGAANFVRRDFYVDDGLASVPEVDDAINLIKNTEDMCAKGGLRLHKFVSNSKEVMQTVPEEDRAKGVHGLNLRHDHLPVERALGIQWCIESDSFQFSITLSDQPLTRRGILSTISSIYDPLGLLAPFLLVGKQILQDMCREKADWDSPLSEALRSRWEKWRSSLVVFKHLKIQRCVKPEDFGNVRTAELHHFSDASTLGYGQCSYLRLVNDKQQVHCTLMMGKARVSPLKVVTIPRLELTAALISVRVSKFLGRELQFKQEISEVFWTDSKIVLAYIANEGRRFHVFVANRIQQIQDHTAPSQWRYVKTEENPADDASRGINADDFIQKSKWLRGPDFLWKADLPKNETTTSEQTLSDNDPEVKRASPLATRMDAFPQYFELKRLEYFSSWNKAKRAIANCMNFKALLKARIIKKQQTDDQHTGDIVPHRPYMVEDLQRTEQENIRNLQAEAFEEELRILSSLKVNGEATDRNVARARKSAIKNTSSLYRLDPFIDKDGIIRVGGRIARAEISPEIRHPAILPRKHHITDLLIRHFHEAVEHQGRGMTTNELRAHGYWILGCSSAVSSLISKCTKCRRQRGQVQDQKMADLPTDRLEPAPPFTYCAVDCFGPWFIKQGRSQVKRYGVLFTCLVSRAIHIEVSNSLSTDSFINALRCFLSIRGPIRLLRSDCGTNFVGAKNELQMDQSHVREFLLKRNCDYMSFEFKMNVPAASHMGGAWERQIRTVRSILASLMDKHGKQLDDESLRTLMYEAAAVVNCRPLTVDNLNDPTLEPLTPNHLLTMKTKVVVPPPGEFQAQEVYAKKRWRRVQVIANEFWARWRKEFLHNLQVRPKWVHHRRDLQEGDVVILKEDDVQRNQWRLGRVEETYPDEDNHVRKVKVLIGDRERDSKDKRVHSQTFLERPIQKLVLLVENPNTTV